METGVLEAQPHDFRCNRYSRVKVHQRLHAEPQRQSATPGATTANPPGCSHEMYRYALPQASWMGQPISTSPGAMCDAKTPKQGSSLFTTRPWRAEIPPSPPAGTGSSQPCPRYGLKRVRRRLPTCSIYRSEYRAGSRMVLALCSTKTCGYVTDPAKEREARRGSSPTKHPA